MNYSKKQALIYTTLALAVLFGVAAAGLVGARSAPAAKTTKQLTALPVETRVVTFDDGFTLKRQFSGWVQARRETVVGFESPGRLMHVLVDEGGTVESGQLLATLDTERLEAQRAELTAARTEAEANLRLASVTLERLRGIVEKGGVSRQSLDEALENQRAADAALKLADQRIATIDVELDKTRLSAPFAAVVIARTADEGRVLDAGHPVLTLQERATPEIRIGVAGRAPAHLEPGRIYPLVWRDAAISARLRALLPVRASTARTVDALFEPLDPPVGMLPGDMVTLALDNHIAQRGIWIPLTALTEGERGLWSVYVAEPVTEGHAGLWATHRAVRRNVEVIHQSDDLVFVKGSFQPDQRIVVTGLQRIVPGQSVRLASDRPNLAGVHHD